MSGLEPVRTHRVRGEPHPAIARVARHLLSFGGVVIYQPQAGEHQVQLARAAAEAGAIGYWAGVTYCQAIAARRRHLDASLAADATVVDWQGEIEPAARFLLVVRALEEVLRADARD